MTATSTQIVPLLKTKLFPPRIQSELVSRARVLAYLEEGLRRKLTVVSAPPGFGKTTLITNWLHSNRPDDVALAWLSLDERDNDTDRFLSYFIEAFQVSDLAIGVAARKLIGKTAIPHPEIVITEVINDIHSFPGQIVLVLDDYHLIENPEIHEAMDYLIEHMPAQLHVVLTCRVDPPLALSRLRGRREMIDIRAQDLRFTAEETEQFLRDTIGNDIADEDILELEQRTEGWVTGLQLAAISMRGRADIHTFIQSFSGQHHHIFDYLADEVLNRQSLEVQQFLFQTSLFSQFTAGLCDAVTGRDDSAAMLERAERSNLFIASLDNERRWFRYHHLFADLLRRKLRQTQPDLVTELRRRASLWFEEHDDPIEALWQSINGEDWTRVSDLVKNYERSLFNQGQSRTLLRLLHAIPEEVVASKPWLLFTRAAAYDLNGEVALCTRDLTALQGLLERIEADPERVGELPEAERRRLHASLLRTLAFIAILNKDYDATLELSEEALSYMTEDELEVQALTKGFRSQVFWLRGDLQKAADDLREVIELSKLTSGTAARLVSLLGVASIEVEWGQMALASNLYDEAIAYADSHGLSNWQYTGRILSFQSEIPYERNDLDVALEIAKRGRDIAAHWVSNHGYDVTYLHLARIHYARGDLESARANLRQSPPYKIGPGMGIVAQIEALQALIDLELGDRRQLSEIEEELLTPFSELPDHIWLWTPALRTRCQVLNALNRYEDAASLLKPLFDLCMKHGWIRQAVQTGAVLAISYQGQGDQSATNATFTQVLGLAEPSGLLRSILDAGAGIEGVISSALGDRGRRSNDTDYLEKLLNIVRESGQRASPNQDLIEPLSEREIEVLQLIAAGHTNAAIADELFVVVGTIKAHAHNIYGKLGVRNRTQAINRGRELGLVD